MTITESKRLLLRPKPKIDESFLGFLLRLAELNVCDTPTWITQKAGLGKIVYGYGLAINEVADWSALVGLTGLDVKHLEYLRYPITKNQNTTSRAFLYGWPVPEYIFRLRQPKICPQCIREAVYCRKIWELALVTACPTHRRMLLDKCPKCGETISWNRKELSCCPCKYDWRDVAEESPIQESELQVSKQAHLLCGLSRRKCGSRSLIERTPLSPLSFEDLICAVYFIARRLLRSDGLLGSLSLKTNAELHSLVHKAFLVFEDWPNKYFSFLDWVREQRNKDGVGKGLKVDFGPYRQSLYKGLPSDGLSFLREAFEEYLLTRWKGGYVSSIRTISKAARRNKNYASPAEAVAALRISYDRFEYLVEKGALEVEVSSRKNCSIKLVKVSSLRRFKRLYDKAKSLKDVALLLGISQNYASDLVDKKLLSPIFDPRVDPCNKWKFSHKEVRSLTNKIQNKIKRIDASSNVKFVSYKWVAVKFGYFNLGIGQLVRAISTGEISGYRSRDEIKLPSLLYSKEEITNYLRAQRQKYTGETFDARELSRYWGVAKDTVYFLIHKELLYKQEALHEGFIDLLITRSEIERFDATYIFGSKLAKELNVSCGFLIDSLRDKDIHPVTGRKVDGGRIYIFKQADLTKVDVETLISTARVQSANRYYPPKLLSIDQTAITLDISEKELHDLVNRGILKPYVSRKHQPIKSGRLCFNSHLVEKVKRRAIDYRGLISKQVAAKMLGETVRDFYYRYVYTGRLRRVRAEGERNTYYLHIEEVEALIKLNEKLANLKNEVLNSSEVAVAFGVGASCVNDWTVSGKLRAVCGPQIDGSRHYLYLKRDVANLLYKSRD